MREEYKKQLASAYGETLDAEIERAIAAAEKEPHVFSKEFEENMAELLRTGKPKYKKTRGRHVRRIFVIVIAAALALTAAACTFTQIGESVVGFFVQVFGDHTEYTEPAVTKERIEEEYRLVPVPLWFEVTDIIKSETDRITLYKNADDDEIKLIQSVNKDAIALVDNGNGSSSEKTIKGKKVSIYATDGYAQALWIQDGYCFILSCSGSFNINDFESWIASVSQIITE